MSETVKHTPGPWVADTTMQYSNHARVNCAEKLICSVGNGESPDIAFDEWSANARLIAAAPELLEALKGFMRNNSVVHGLPLAAKAARAAITKAGG